MEHAKAELRRPLGRSERVYWLLDQHCCTNFAVLAELEGRWDTQALQGAIRRCWARHPLLGCAIEVTAGGAVAFRPRQAPPPELTVQAGGPATWRQALDRELDRPFPPRSETLQRCVLFQDPDSSAAALLVGFSHASTDARGAALLVEELLARAAGREQPRGPAGAPLPPQEALYPARYRGWRVLFPMVAMWAREAWQALCQGRPWQLPDLPAPSEPRQLRSFPVRLDAQRSARLLLRARQERTTVHGALGATQLLALAAEFPADAEPLLELLSALDMRPLLAQPVAPSQLGMFAAMASVGHRLGRGREFWDLAREVRQGLRRKLGRGDAHLLWPGFPPDWLFPPDARGARRLGRLLAGMPPSSILTNLGQAGADPAAPVPGLRALHFAIGPGSGGLLCSAAASYAGALKINCCFDLARLPEARAQRIAARMQAELERAATGQR